MPTAPEDIAHKDVLNAKREHWMAAAEAILQKSQGVTKHNHHQYKGTYDRLTKIQEEFDAVQEAILELNLRLTDQERLPVKRVQKAFDDLVDTVQKKILQFQISDPAEPLQQPPASKPLVSLPKLTLPKFDGSIDNWPSFINMYNVAIHDHPTLTKAEKFTYLKSLLTGDAYPLVRALAISDENYDAAYALLESRFQNVRRQAFFNFQGLLSLPFAKNHTDLPALSSKLHEHKHALQALGFTEETYGPLLVTIIWDRLHPYLKRRLDDHRADPAKYPTMTEVNEWLKKEVASALDACSSSPQKNSPRSSVFFAGNSGQRPAKRKSFKDKHRSTPSRSSASTQHSGPEEDTAVTAHSSSPGSPEVLCSWCDEKHPVYRCELFRRASIETRKKLVRLKGLCYNCLRAECRRNPCVSSRRCNTCQQPHHSLLHEDSTTSPKTPVKPTPSDASSSHTVTTALVAGARKVTTILPTAQVRLSTSTTGKQITVRAILDSGAQDCFLTQRCAQLLGLKPTKMLHAVSGLAETSVPVEGTINVNIHSKTKEIVFYDQKVVVVRRLTGFVPSVPITGNVREAVVGFELADSTFDKPGEIDALLGAELFTRILSDGPMGSFVDLGTSGPTGMKTIFGLVLIGSAPSLLATQDAANHTTTMLTQSPPPSLPDLLERFWKMEDITAAPKLSPEEEAAEAFYVKTTVQKPNGRYEVRLPFKENHPPLGESLKQAELRFRALERRFTRDPVFKDLYLQFMKEYEDNGFMVPGEIPSPAAPCYFIPHHGVLSATSSTTKLRVVFDASAKTSNGVSLNDILLPGISLQNDIREVLLSFRRHSIVFSADIKQMFLQVDLHRDDWKYQMILWRSDPSQPLRAYYLCTVTFGVCSSPWLAIRTVQQTGIDHGTAYPSAARILQEESYVDNITSGGESPQEVVQNCKELKTLLHKGGFYLRKWTCSHPELLTAFPVADLECPILEDPDNPRFSILGLNWVPAQDHFSYKVKLLSQPATKRGVVATTASIFDPCGWLAPVVFLAKAFIQELWMARLDWDDPLPDAMKKRWETYLAGLPALKEVTVPRLLTKPDSNYQLHGFSDSSEAGFSAVLYLRSAPKGGGLPSVSMITAQTRVAPLQRLSLPRLELSGAVLLSQLVDRYAPQLTTYYKVEKIVLWTDSTIVLSWIGIPVYRLKTFVANRVATIQAIKLDITWRHVPSLDNPADCASRGVPPAELNSMDLWWHGPSWLAQPASCWPTLQPAEPDQSKLELKEPTQVLLAAAPTPVYPDRSSWSRTKRAMGWILRFISRSRQRAQTRKVGLPLTALQVVTADQVIADHSLTAVELENAELQLIKTAQRSEFQEEIQRLNTGRSCTNRVQALTPYFDAQGVIRVGGRLRNAPVPDDAKHPILLPANHRLTRLLLDHYHYRLHDHPGPQLLHALLARRYWILAGRNAVRACVHRCYRCFRARPRQVNPFMGDLPTSRLSTNAPFTHTGADYAGPWSVKIHLLRSSRVVQMYLCIFVCFSTKATHIEVVQDLTTPAFMASFQRFVARRGRPSEFYSDCGTNFKGAANELARLLTADNLDLRRFAEDNEIKFHFNPPAAPHQGGLWESAVKSMKSLLKRTLGTTVLHLEEFQTLCCRIEAMLNSRPLTPLSSDPNDLQPLTPGHFLIGRPLTAIPEVLHSDEDLPRLRRWYLVQGMAQQIWKRWQLEYTHLLQPRRKWTKHHPPLQVGTVVLIHDPNAPPLAWRMGRVRQVHPGSDGVVRVAVVKTTQGELTRPVHKLYPLPIGN